MIQQIETRGKKKQKILDIEETIVILTRTTNMCIELEFRQNLTPRKKRMNITTINLKR
jgi:hypothetical protein